MLFWITVISILLNVFGFSATVFRMRRDGSFKRRVLHNYVAYLIAFIYFVLHLILVITLGPHHLASVILLIKSTLVWLYIFDAIQEPDEEEIKVTLETEVAEKLQEQTQIKEQLDQ